MFARLGRLMHRGENDDADRRSRLSRDPASPPPSSKKLREKLQKLAEWRIDLSSIEFEQDASEIRGGYATVSRALLVSTSGTGKRVDNAARFRRKNKPHGETTTRKPTAVKKLKIENGKDKERVLGLALREARFLTEISHENVIKLEGFVEDLTQDKVWLVFPWAANGNLKDFVALGEWEIPERVSLIKDVTEGVEYLHSQDPPIYHGDLKSANVLVNSHCRAVITDFGSARRIAKKDPTAAQPYKSENQAQPALLLETKICEATNTVTLTGNQYTLRWAAPELLMGDEPGLWGDIWALGWIFYEVMTNTIPFQNVRNDSMVIVHVIQGNLPSVADHANMVSIRRLYSLMITCWNIDPSKRPMAEDCRKLMAWMPMVVPDRQRAANTSVSPTRSPTLLIQMGKTHLAQNDYSNAMKLFNEALGIFTETADNAGKANALYGLAEVNRGRSNYSEAVKLDSEAIQIHTDIGNRRGRAGALSGLADTHLDQGQCSKAVTLYSEVVQICTEIGDRGRKVEALLGLARVQWLQYEFSEAVQLYSEVLQICADIGSRRGRLEALFGLAELHRIRKQYSQAVQLLSESLQISIDIDDRHRRAQALMYLANVHRDQDQHEDAIRLYEQAVGIFEEIGSTQGAAVASQRRSDVLRARMPDSPTAP